MLKTLMGLLLIFAFVALAIFTRGTDLKFDDPNAAEMCDTGMGITLLRRVSGQTNYASFNLIFGKNEQEAGKLLHGAPRYEPSSEGGHSRLVGYDFAMRTTASLDTASARIDLQGENDRPGTLYLTIKSDDPTLSVSNARCELGRRHDKGVVTVKADAVRYSRWHYMEIDGQKYRFSHMTLQDDTVSAFRAGIVTHKNEYPASLQYYGVKATPSGDFIFEGMSFEEFTETVRPNPLAYSYRF